MEIVYAMTRNLYPYFKTALKSLLDHNNPEKIYILAEDDKLPYRLPKNCKVINVSGQEYFGPNCPNIHSQFTYMAMMRILYTELMPECDKVIQLDIDTIVCDSLQGIWDVDLTGKWFAAVEEYESNYKPYGEKYYNIGVAVFNLAQMRKDNIVPYLVKKMNRKQMFCVEQDALNSVAVRRKKVVGLPVRYNECFCCGQTVNPAIVHYAGVRDWYENTEMTRVEYIDKYRKKVRKHNERSD